MPHKQHWKFDGLLPRTKDPEGLDKEPDDPFAPRPIPFAEPSAEGKNSALPPAVADELAK